MPLAEPVPRGRHVLRLALALALPHALPAQQPPAADSAPVIRRIDIRRETIFDSVETRNWFSRAANKLHYRTREAVVRRELLFHEGERYDTLRVFETIQNLRGMGIFRRVQVDTARVDGGLVARVTTRDAWSTRGDVRFRSTGDQVDYQLSFIEDNFLGNATRAGVRYRRTPDRTLTSFQLRQRRLIDDRIGGEASYESRSDGHRAVAALLMPFYSVVSPFSFEVRAEALHERILRFSSGEPVASDTLWRRYWITRADVAAALQSSNAGYLRVGVTGLVRRDDYAASEQGPFGEDLVATAGPFLEWRRARFVTTTKFLGLGRDEESVDLSTTLRAGVLVAARALGYPRDGLGGHATIHTGVELPRGFLLVDASFNGLRTAAGLDSGSVFVAGTLALRPAADHLVIIHAQGGAVESPRPGSEYSYGLTQGPRAFRAHAFTGDRAFLTTTEYRVVPPGTVGSLANLGFAAFVDYGGAWYSGSPPRYGASLGVGLRFGVSRAANLSPNRLDLAYRVANDRVTGGWVIAVGKGLLFSTTPR